MLRARAGLVPVAVLGLLVALLPALLLTEPSLASTSRQVSLTGTIQVLVVDYPDRHEEVVRLDTGDRSVRLRGVAKPPSAGSRVRVRGVVRDDSIVVDDLEVLASPARAATARSHRALIMRSYWSASPPANPTTTRMQTVLSQASAWFKEVSHGRYSFSGRVTPWLKIDKPPSCYLDDRAMNQAISRARAKGFDPGNFSRFVLYMPCQAGPSGVAYVPGSRSWLFGTTDLGTMVHELGHNLGLEHANTRLCRRDGKRVTWSSSCINGEYADYYDVMGAGPAGHLAAPRLSRLGWLIRWSRVTSSVTRTLTPYEDSSAGHKAIKVDTRGRDYWVELRTARGFDRGIPGKALGVVVHLAGGELLDMLPRMGQDIGGWFRDENWGYIPVGGTWTTPEGVRISVTALAGTAPRWTSAKVAIRFGAGAGKVASPPSSLSSAATQTGAELTWGKATANGATIIGYEVTRQPGNIVRNVMSINGGTRSTSFTGLRGDTGYTFSVRTINLVGTGSARTSATVRPLAKPLVEGWVTAGPLLGVETFQAFVTPYSPPVSRVTRVELLVDGVVRATKAVPFGESWADLDFDTRVLTAGQHSFVLRAYDNQTPVRTGVSAQMVRTVLRPQVTVTSPASGSVVGGEVDVEYTVTGWSPAYANVYRGTEWLGFGYVGEPLSVDLFDVPAGPQTLRLELEDYDEKKVAVEFEVVVVTPSVTITSPTDGTAVSAETPITWSTVPADLELEWVSLYVDGNYEGGTSDPSASPLTMPYWLESGLHHLEIGFSTSGRELMSDGITVDLQNPAPE